MNATSRYFVISLAVLVILGGVYLLWFHSTTKGIHNSVHLTFAQEVAQAEQSNAAGLSTTTAAVAAQTVAQPFAQTYTDPTYGFSFGYPTSLKVGAANSGSGTTILAQNASAHIGFQVYITPWQGEAVTASAVEQSLPQIGMHDVQNLKIDGAPALAFTATDPNFGDSVQVWFTYKNYLYQVSTYASQLSLLQKVLGTWKWQ